MQVLAASDKEAEAAVEIQSNYIFKQCYCSIRSLLQNLAVNSMVKKPRPHHHLLYVLQRQQEFCQHQFFQQHR